LTRARAYCTKLSGFELSASTELYVGRDFRGSARLIQRRGNADLYAWMLNHRAAFVAIKRRTMPRAIVLFAAFALGAYAGAQSKPATLGNWSRTPEQVAAGLHSPPAAEIAKQKPVKVFDGRFAALAVASFGSTAADIALARSCQAAHTCREGNPLMLGRAAIPVGVGAAAAENILAYEVKKRGSRKWVVPQVSTLAWHSVGIVMGARIAAR
jgi:hypothetical protein